MAERANWPVPDCHWTDLISMMLPFLLPLSPICGAGSVCSGSSNGLSEARRAWGPDALANTTRESTQNRHCAKSEVDCRRTHNDIGFSKQCLGSRLPGPSTIKGRGARDALAKLTRS